MKKHVSYLQNLFIMKKTNKIITGTLKLDIVETSEENPLKYTNIELDNAYPMTNEEYQKHILNTILLLFLDSYKHKN